MIVFKLNGEEKTYSGDPQTSLLRYLRDEVGLISIKDGCSGQGACGACLLEMNGKATLSCLTPMKKVDQAEINTIEGFDPELKKLLGQAFIEKGAVQCGFCSPGFLSRAKILLQENPDPTRNEVIKALKFNLCRCTGYVKIVDAILYAAARLKGETEPLSPQKGNIGTSLLKYQSYEKAIGEAEFIDDMKIEGLLHGALKFSEHPRAKVIKINIAPAENFPGVVRVFTSKDIPGKRTNGLIKDDWPLMIHEGETTRYIGDVLAGVVAETPAIAREAAELIQVDYEELVPLTDMLQAEESDIKIHEDGNLLSCTKIKRGGDTNALLQSSAHVVKATYQTQSVEHGFLETEAAIAQPWQERGIKLFTQSQGLYEDRSIVSKILGIPKTEVDVTLVPCGGAFGGKEDLTVQGHAALFAFHLRKPVKVRLDRAESLRMHPKRHPLKMEYTLGCDQNGKLTALKADIIGDTGAYASVGDSVMSRAAGHAAGGYHLPAVDIVAKAVYTNNIPCGAMRGFGVNQVTFAIEAAVDELCEKGGFDPWQFRYDNALENGLMTTTGQILKKGTGLKETLLAVKEEFEGAEYAGIAVGIKNIGFGNGITDESEVTIDIISDTEIILHHGWTEMGQGIDTVAIQIFCEETGINTPQIIRIGHSTTAESVGGATTASRGTYLLGNSIIEAVTELKEDLKSHSLAELSGKSYRGRWACDWTHKPGTSEEVISHVAYSFASQVVILNSKGAVKKVVAAHDIGKAINPILLEGQIEGGVMMGLGYALSERLPLENGRLTTTKFRQLGIPRVHQSPEIVTKIIEVPDPYGPYGAKGIGEIGLVPTAAATANAYYQFDKKRRYKLPLDPFESSREEHK